MISVIQCNKDSYCEHIAGGVNMYLYECVRLLALECAVCLCVCVFVCLCDIKSEYKGKNTLCHTSINVKLCCIKHTSRSFWH